MNQEMKGKVVTNHNWRVFPLVDLTQLFDLSTDPCERTNLADRPVHAAKVAEMTALLFKEMVRYGDTYPLTIDNPRLAEWSPTGS